MPYTRTSPQRTKNQRPHSDSSILPSQEPSTRSSSVLELEDLREHEDEGGAGQRYKLALSVGLTEFSNSKETKLHYSTRILSAHK